MVDQQPGREQFLAASVLAGRAEVIDVAPPYARLRFVELWRGTPGDLGVLPAPDGSAVAHVVAPAGMLRPGLRLALHLAWSPADNAFRLIGPPLPHDAPPPGAGPGARARHAIADPAHNGRPIGCIDHPRGWAASSAVVYNPRDFNGIGLFFARVASPDGADGVEVFPNEGFNYSAWPGSSWWGQGRPGVPGPYQVKVGDLCFGSTTAAPMSPADALRRHIVPRHRRHAQELEILGAAAAPWLWQAFQAPAQWDPNLARDAAVMRVAYRLGDRCFEEEFTCGTYCFPPDYAGNGRWGTVLVRSFWAPRGRLDAARDERVDLLRSFTIDDGWSQWCMSVGQQLQRGLEGMAQSLAVEGMMQASREQAQRAEYFQWSQDTRQQTYNEWSASDEWRQRGMGDMLRGQTRYADPGSAAGVPFVDTSHSPYVWTDGKGAFRGTSDPNDDPNVGSAQTWTRARRLDETGP